MLKPLVLPPGSENISKNKTHWIPRHEMVNVLQDVIDESGAACNVDLLYEHSFVSLQTSNCGSHIVVTCESVASKTKVDLEAKLIVGADGINSEVREYLSKHPESLKEWNYNSNKFKAIRKHSPSVGLRIKVNFLIITKK